MLPGLLVQEDRKVGRLHITALMKRMGIRTLHGKPSTLNPALESAGIWASATVAARIFALAGKLRTTPC
jgi:hypothetical protein